MPNANEQDRDADVHGATIDNRNHKSQSPSHPYLIATITPGGGLIVHMHWLNQPPEPLAFTNEHDFSAWLKGAVAQCSGRIPQGIRPQSRAKNSSLQHAPLPEFHELEEEPKVQARGGLRGLLGGRA